MNDLIFLVTLHAIALGAYLEIENRRIETLDREWAERCKGAVSIIPADQKFRVQMIRKKS